MLEAMGLGSTRLQKATEGRRRSQEFTEWRSRRRCCVTDSSDVNKSERKLWSKLWLHSQRQILPFSYDVVNKPNYWTREPNPSSFSLLRWNIDHEDPAPCASAEADRCWGGNTWYAKILAQMLWTTTGHPVQKPFQLVPPVNFGREQSWNNLNLQNLRATLQNLYMGLSWTFLWQKRLNENARSVRCFSVPISRTRERRLSLELYSCSLLLQGLTRVSIFVNHLNNWKPFNWEADISHSSPTEGSAGRVITICLENKMNAWI